jgi:hypothetical protein
LRQAHHFERYVAVRVGVVGQDIDAHRLAIAAGGTVGVGDRFLVIAFVVIIIAVAVAVAVAVTEGWQCGGVDVGDAVLTRQGCWHQLELAGMFDMTLLLVA